jgi:hypothetical protein
LKIGAKLLLALTVSASLGGCAVLDSVRGDSGKKNNTPTVGNRVNILGSERDTDVDAALAGVAVILPTTPGHSPAATPRNHPAMSSLAKASRASGRQR